MSDKTSIEWTATRHDDGTVTPGATWNPIRGTAGRHTCARISPGCDHCYAATMNRRGLGGTAPLDFGQGETLIDPARLDEKALLQPLKWREPRQIFVCSMTDLFGSWVPDGWLDRIFAVMALANRHTFIVLTKRPRHMQQYLTTLRGQLERLISASRLLGYSLEFERQHLFDWPLPNVWVGVTIEEDRYSWRANLLRETPAAIRWVSAEPLLSGLPSLDLTGIDWLVTGGESGPGARICQPDWVRELRDRCQDSGTAFFHKQWGAYVYPEQAPEDLYRDLDATHNLAGIPEQPYRVGKHRSGRLLDGRTWDDYPTPPATDAARGAGGGCL